MEDLQKDEIVAIQAIFGEEIVQQVAPTELKICIPSIEATPRIEMHVFLPQDDYPSSSPPVLELRCDLFDGSTLSDMARQMEEMFQPGEVVIYTWIAWLQEEWEQRKPPPPPPPPPSSQEKISTSSAAVLGQKELKEHPAREESAQHTELMRQISTKIVHGEPLTEKKSTFQAHLFQSTDPAEVPAVMDYLLQNNKIRAATHNIMAYRIESQTRQGVFHQDSDDDGESAAGGRLLHLLQLVDAKNVIVVVSRWFGGTLLGPARFGLINKAARDLLESQGLIHTGGGSNGK